jgi:hypothetical protein
MHMFRQVMLQKAIGGPLPALADHSTSDVGPA